MAEYHIQLSKVLVNTTRIAFWDAQSDTDYVKATDTLKVQLPAVIVDYIIDKNIIHYPGVTGSAANFWASFNPWRKILDHKNITRRFRLKGIIKDAAWGTTGATEATVMNKIIKIKDICEDGGTFTLTWMDNVYTVNCVKIIFTQATSKWNSIEFTIDLIEGEDY